MMLVILKCRDLSNNHIGGSMPTSLPITLQNLYVFTVKNSLIENFMYILYQSDNAHLLPGDHKL